MEHLSIIKSLSIHIAIQFNITVHQNSYIKLYLKVLVINILVLDFTSISIKKCNVHTVFVPFIKSLTIYTKDLLFKLSDKEFYTQGYVGITFRVFMFIRLSSLY